MKIRERRKRWRRSGRILLTHLQRTGTQDIGQGAVRQLIGKAKYTHRQGSLCIQTRGRPILLVLVGLTYLQLLLDRSPKMLAPIITLFEDHESKARYYVSPTIWKVPRLLEPTPSRHNFEIHPGIEECKKSQRKIRYPSRKVTGQPSAKTSARGDPIRVRCHLKQEAEKPSC